MDLLEPVITERKNFGGEASKVCNVGEYPQGEALPVLCSQDQAHDSSQVHKMESGSLETLGNSILREDKSEDSAEASMELERYRG